MTTIEQECVTGEYSAFRSGGRTRTVTTWHDGSAFSTLEQAQDACNATKMTQCAGILKQGDQFFIRHTADRRNNAQGAEFSVRCPRERCGNKYRHWTRGLRQDQSNPIVKPPHRSLSAALTACDANAECGGVELSFMGRDVFYYERRVGAPLAGYAGANPPNMLDMGWFCEKCPGGTVCNADASPSDASPGGGGTDASGVILNSNSDSGGLPMGAIVGIAIGSVVLVALAVFLIVSQARGKPGSKAGSKASKL